MNVIATVLFALTASSGVTTPDSSFVEGGGRSYDGSQGEVAVATPRVPEPDIEIDGVVSEGDWEEAARLDGFTQYDPTEGIAASHPTEVLLFVSDDAIYFAVRAFDAEPSGIRATMAERDNVARSDDYVRFALDTFDDQRRAYVFTVNPYGVQQDGIWVEGGGDRRGFGPPIDDNPDFIWESGARIQEWGWSAEVRIPFKSLRFPEVELQTWGFNVFRRIQRSGFQQSWAPITGNVANLLSQAGELNGLRDLDPGLFMELNPVVTGRRLGTFDEDLDELVHDDPEADFGLNATYGLTSNLTLDATINPDFSQVEADAGQIAVNERFALFFPEKRPFFLEGTEIFQLPSQLIFTRTIADPAAGAKITGKVGRLNLGYLGAVDQAGDSDDDAVVNILRLRQDVGGSSTVGGLYTDRTRSGDDFNRVGGLDTRLVLGRRYTLTALAAGSWTRNGADAATETGSLVQARLERAGREFSFESSFLDIGPDFRARSGFLRRIGDTQLRAQARINRYGKPGAFIERWGPVVEVQGFWSHDRFWEGKSFEEGRLQLSLSTSFRNNLTLFTTVSRTRFDHPLEEYDGLFAVDGEDDPDPQPFRPDMELFEGLDAASVFLFFNNWEKVRGNLRIQWQETPVFDRRLGVPVEPGESWGGNLSLNLFPTTHLRGEVGLRHETIHRKRDGSRYSSATIPRIRLQYQFTRAFFLRTIVEYGAQEREPLLHPVTGRPLAFCDEGCELRGGSETNDVHLEWLVSYEPSPGTVVFLGYTRDVTDSEAFGFADFTPRADGLFAKVSYRFRF